MITKALAGAGWAAAAVVIAATVAACGDAQTTTIGSSSEPGAEPAERVLDRQLRWESVIVEDLGHSLTIVFTGGPPTNLETDFCAGEYEAQVEDRDGALVITLYSLVLADPPSVPDGYGCDDLGYQRKLDVWPGPGGLDGRTIIDGSIGEERIVIDETLILMPLTLPEGWEEWYASPDGDGMRFAYGPPADDRPVVSYFVNPTDDGYYNMDPETLAWDLTTQEEIGVRGNAGGAVVITSLEDGARTIVFEHGGRHHWVQVQAGTDLAVGLAFVESLG